MSSAYLFNIFLLIYLALLFFSRVLLTFWNSRVCCLHNSIFFWNKCSLVGRWPWTSCIFLFVLSSICLWNKCTLFQISIILSLFLFLHEFCFPVKVFVQSIVQLWNWLWTSLINSYEKFRPFKAIFYHLFSKLSKIYNVATSFFHFLHQVLNGRHTS